MIQDGGATFFAPDSEFKPDVARGRTAKANLVSIRVWSADSQLLTTFLQGTSMTRELGLRLQKFILEISKNGPNKYLNGASDVILQRLHQGMKQIQV